MRFRAAAHAATPLLVGLFSFGILAPLATAATSLSQHGITWHFAGDHTTGKFVNGDFWVLGPVTITRITPEDPDPNDDIDLHGAVVNPKPVLRSPFTQSFDSRIGAGTTYRRADNVARQLPLRLTAGTSLVSARSRGEVGDDRLYLSDAAVLTVLSKAPPKNSFRPPYAGTDKTIRGTLDQLDLTIFRSLPRVSQAPSLSSFDPLFNQVMIDLLAHWPNTSLKTANAGSAYGRDIAREVGDAVLALNLDFPEAQKRALAIRLVQRGIDTYGLAHAGMKWTANGGHNNGRKLPLLIAARALNDPQMLAYGDAARHFIFQEDIQHWFLTQQDVALPRALSLHTPYTSNMIGWAEWAPSPTTERDLAGAEWSRAYRHVNGSVNAGTVLAAELMGLRPLWNWDALFAYISERYWPAEEARLNQIGIPAFHRAMWRAYRDPKAATVLPPAIGHSTSTARLMNLSTRGRILRDEGLIAGFVLQGQHSRPMLIRGIGPGLRPYGITDPLHDVRVTVFRDSTAIAESAPWTSNPQKQSIISAGSRVGAFTLADTSQDAALLLDLGPGSYSVAVEGNGNSTGVTLIELYDAGDATGAGASCVINLSTRGHVGTGEDILVSGIVVAGSQPKRLLIRALGPALKPYGIARPLADPQLRVTNGDAVVATNDDWSGDGEVAAAANMAGAFPLPAGSKDAALVVTLPPGNYTAQVSGRAGTSGTAMVEVYDVP